MTTLLLALAVLILLAAVAETHRARQAAELARDSYRLELFGAWGEIDRYRAFLGLKPRRHIDPTTDLRLNREHSEDPA